MKRYKNFLCRSLILTMLLALLAGCNAKDDSSAETSVNDNPTDSTTFSYSSGIDENGFFEGVKALDYVETFDYQALSIPNDIHQIPEERLQAGIDNILDYLSSGSQITDRAVADGDTVNIDYVGSVDGVAFDGGSTMGAGTDVTIGVTSYIDDFLEQLIGHMPGETINVEVTFPDVYQEASLQGKDAVFVTTINYIADTSADLQKEAIQEYISEYLSNEVTVRSIPDPLMEYQEKAMVQYYQDFAEYYGMGFEEFLVSSMGVSSVDDLIELNHDSNLQNAAYTLAAQAVAEDAGITVSEEDMVNYFTDYSPYIEQYGLPYLKQIVLYQKVIDYIISNAVLE